jgi:hypothetical protein
VFRWVEFGSKPSPLDPGWFHFYEHTPPAPCGGLREHVSRVVLRFEAREFTQPEWKHYRTIPRAIQEVRFELAADAIPTPAADRLLRQKDKVSG